jgi:hypothetical protein
MRSRKPGKSPPMASIATSNDGAQEQIQYRSSSSHAAARNDLDHSPAATTASSTMRWHTSISVVF